MPAKKSRKVEPLTVGEFFERHGRELRMKLIGSSSGYDRRIIEPTINRPGLALAGYFTYFASKRLQVIGNAELSYLRNLSAEDQHRVFTSLCARHIPCIVVARGSTLPGDLMKVAKKAGISVFQTTMITMKFINAATIALEEEFAPRTAEHGCMVDVRGIGILIRGPSGCGKSESVLGLLARGASLVADDLVQFRNVEGREILGRAHELGRNHMEVRGLGIINVPALFGVGTIRLEKRLDLVITLRPLEDLNELERTGLDRKRFHLLGLRIPHVELPVAPGRDIAQLIEVAALDQKMKSFGHDSSLDFNKKLLKIMRNKRIN
ncbi:MAG: HPr(Ser) kinase/phosphatase [Verrucomicrobiales bacterium]